MIDRMLKRMNKQAAVISCLAMLLASLSGYAAASPAAAMPSQAMDEAEPLALAPSGDAYVQGGGNANVNFGAAKSLDVKHISGNGGITREALLAFDLSGVGVAIGKAELYIYEVSKEGDGTAIDNQVYSVDPAWEESTVTWNTKPAYEEYLGVIQSDTAAKWHAVDVTSYVKQQQAAGQRASFGIRQEDAAGLRVGFASREAAGNTPYLAITGTGELQLPVWPEHAQLEAEQTGDTSVRLTWPPASDASGIAGYRVHQDGSELQTVTGSVYSYEAANLVPGATYTFKVEAGNAAGYWTQDGPQVTVTIAVAAEDRNVAPAADAYVQGGASANTNYGTAKLLDVKHVNENGGITREALLAFDLSEVHGEIGKAELYVYESTKEADGTAIDNQVYGVDPAWNEAAVTWNTKPDFQDYLGTIRSDTAPKWHAVDVTSYVKRQQAAGQRASFGIRQEAAAGMRVAFASREATANTPYLRISATRTNEEAPTWPAAAVLAAVDVDETDVTLSWPAATDADGIAGYRVYRNGDPVGDAAGTTLRVDGLTAGSSYTFKVEAGDPGGNWSSDGPYVTVTLPMTKLEQVKHGNIFMSDESVLFRIVTTRPYVSWSVQDLWGEEVASGREAVAGGQLQLAVPTDRVGYFKLTVQAERDGKQPSVVTTPFAVFAPYDFRAVTDSPFGINVHMDRADRGWTPDLAELIEYAGIKNVRDGIGWSTAEFAKGQYAVPAAHEAVVDEMNARKLNIMMMLAFTNKFYDDNSTPYTDEGREGYANYGRFLLEHFGDKVASYEIYNEFNIEFGSRGNGMAGSRPDAYYEMMKKAYDTMKLSDPDKPIVGMSTSSVPFNWLASVFQLGGLDKSDVVSVHPYQFPRTPEHLTPEMDQLHDLIGQYNAGSPKPVWITEISYPTHASAAGVSEKTQADYLVRTFVLSLASGVDKVFWYDLMSDGLDPANVEHNYAILYHQDDPRGRHTPKPAYAAMGAMTRQLTGAAFAADESDADGIRSYKFTRGEDEVRVAWSEGQLRPAAILAQHPIRIVDLMGNEKTYEPHEGKIYYTLQDEPIYIIGEIGGIAADETFAWSGELSVVGEDASLTLTADNEGAAPFDGELTVQGQSYPIHAASGQTVQIPVTVPGLSDEGDLTVQGELTSGGRLIGHLSALVHFDKPYRVQIKPLFTEDGTGKELQAVITNRSTRQELTLDAIRWSLGELSGTVNGPVTIQPDSVGTETIPLAGLSNNVEYPLHLTIDLHGHDPVQIDSKANFTPVYHIGEPGQGVTIDWSAAEAIRFKGLIGQSWNGVDDLSGTVTLNWDEEKFYLTADIIDDTFAYSDVQKDMYRNDGFQFGVVRGIPGENSEDWYDSGFAMTPAGLQTYHWFTPSGVPVGLIEDSDLTITRDEANKTTHYAFAIPWSDLAPINPQEDEVFSFSLLLNENDGSGRKGYIEWGSGIGAAKTPTLYRTIQLIRPQNPPQTAQNSTAQPGTPVLSNDNGYDTGLRDGAYNVTMNMWYGNNGTMYKLYENDVLIDTQTLTDGAPAAQQVATAIGGRGNGTYRYAAELTNAFGTTRSAEMVVQVTDAAPGKPVLSHDNWDGDGQYGITMNMWWGTNATAYNLYENGVLIDSQALAANTPNAQSAVTGITNRAVGAYEYRAELVNDAGAVSSETLTVNVTK